MWKNISERGRPIWCVRIACWIPKATNTHTDCVILIAFPLQQRLHERAPMVRYTHIACLFLLPVDITPWPVLQATVSQKGPPGHHLQNVRPPFLNAALETGNSLATDRGWMLDVSRIFAYTDMRRLTTGIRSEKCVVWRFRRCANVHLHKPR
jgi:hypothetical protein